MDIEVIKKLIVEYQEFIGSVKFHRRSFSFEINARYVIVGIRQAGKSYLLYQRAHELLESGHELREICYINFDDERLMGFSAADFDMVLDAYHSMFDCAPILMFDEIQNIEGWERFARRLANQGQKVFITGSNAKMLSREIATTLGERYIAKTVEPYSFEEYLTASGMVLDKNWWYGSARMSVRRIFETYLRFGGFPESFKYDDKRDWLNGLFGRIFFNDMVVRNGVKNVDALRLCVKRLAENVGQPISCTRLSNLLKAVGYGTSPASVLDYLGFMRESCLVFSVANYAAKFAEKESVKKHYFADNGILNLFLSNPDSALLENLCALWLRRKYSDRLFFYRKNIEVDFFVPDEGLAVQAAISVNDEETLHREVSALVKLNAYHPLKTMVIVTLDENRVIDDKSGVRIEVVPIWRWMIDGESCSKH